MHAYEQRKRKKLDTENTFMISGQRPELSYLWQLSGMFHIRNYQIKPHFSQIWLFAI